jgi:MFS family permease
LVTLKKALGEQEAIEQLAQITTSLSADKNKNKGSILELIKPSMRLVMVVGISIAILQQITGINAVFFYAPMIFEQTGIGTDASFMQAILVGLTNVVFTLIAIALIDKIGRKSLLTIGVSGIVVCMFSLAYQFNAATYTLTSESLASLASTLDINTLQPIIGATFSSDLTFKAALVELLGASQAATYESSLVAAAIHMNGTVILMSILGFVACFAVSLGPVMWVLFSELFPNRIRGIAISFVGLINSGVSFLVQLMFPWELANLGAAFTFAFYGGFALIGLSIILKYLPETKGKSLEELETILIKE